MIQNNVFIFLIVFIFDQCYSSENCTDNFSSPCHETIHREWPRFDFEFYDYEVFSSHRQKTLSSSSLENNPIGSSIGKKSDLQTNHGENGTIEQWKGNNPNELQLLQTSFKLKENFRIPQAVNLTEFFRQNLQQLYEIGWERHQPNNRIPLGVKVYAIKQNESDSNWINVVYNLEKEGKLISSEEAINGLSKITNDHLTNVTDFESYRNVEAYSLTSNNSSSSSTKKDNQSDNYVNYGSISFWMILFGILLLLLLILCMVWCFICKDNDDDDEWFQNVNTEIGRFRASNSDENLNDTISSTTTSSSTLNNRHKQMQQLYRQQQQNRWNSTSKSTDDLIESSSGRRKSDKSSQYDFDGASLISTATTTTHQRFQNDVESRSVDTRIPTIKIPRMVAETFTNNSENQNIRLNGGNSQKKQITIEKINPKITDLNLNDRDFDRISYTHSKEIIEETHKHPNILEIKLREETQSIVKEIKKELDRLNQRSIFNEDCSTSEA
ncbi:BR serine/threonine-protein kinase [Sarcoptes scabiei]|nr:BR serine/threonine-protein kinase [Sarcoptes scabiei]